MKYFGVMSLVLQGENAGKQRIDAGDNQENSKLPTKVEISCCQQPHASWALKGRERERKINGGASLPAKCVHRVADGEATSNLEVSSGYLNKHQQTETDTLLPCRLVFVDHWSPCTRKKWNLFLQECFD